MKFVDMETLTPVPHEASLEPTTKRREDLGKHSVCSHFPGDRNCEICQRTKITRAPCRRRNGGAVPRAVNSGDLTTADHKVLNNIEFNPFSKESQDVIKAAGNTEQCEILDAEPKAQCKACLALGRWHRLLHVRALLTR